MRRDLLDLLPADPDRSAPAQPPDNPAEEARSLSPYSGTAQERDDLERLAWIALEREVVDVPAPAPFAVHPLGTPARYATLRSALTVAGCSPPALMERRACGILAPGARRRPRSGMPGR